MGVIHEKQAEEILVYFSTESNATIYSFKGFKSNFTIFTILLFILIFFCLCFTNLPNEGLFIKSSHKHSHSLPLVNILLLKI